MNSDALAGAAPEGPRPPQTAGLGAVRSWDGSSRRIWTIYVLVIYGYLYLCMFFGGPFTAFDHENYIGFLNQPFPFFFEPGFTALAYLLNMFIGESLRFPLQFVILTLPPFLLVWSADKRERSGASGMMLYACILTKAFYIGFFAQRFFFAELWVTALVIRSTTRKGLSWKEAMPGLLLHFSTLTILPSLVWLRGTFSMRKLMTGGLFLGIGYIYIMFFSGFQFLGYDYSRYLDGNGPPGGYSLFTIFEMAVLAMICKVILPKKDVANFITLVVLVLIMKMAMGEVEVFSRVFQIQVDLIMILAGLWSKRRAELLYFFGFGFFVIQLLFTSISGELIVFHSTALLNALGFK
ncbi:hypothetical protein [Geothrix sp. 21YS21S-2]|uniref:hypothetical protein n=1 Tax=Geothrix sp. 21YS21S-2 TaxID=3068893 RepID=UPI0027B9EC02|nr:hypothetical protein [Geothrix sp. 21YS21S-2]